MAILNKAFIKRQGMRLQLVAFLKKSSAKNLTDFRSLIFDLISFGQQDSINIMTENFLENPF